MRGRAVKPLTPFEDLRTSPLQIEGRAVPSELEEIGGAIAYFPSGGGSPSGFWRRTRVNC